MVYEDPQNDSITHTIGRLVDDVRDLFREEMALVRAELRQEVGAFGAAAARMGFGAVAGAFALAFLLLGLAQGFAALVGWPAWGGYFAMAVVLGVITGVALMSGRRKLGDIQPVPQTVASIKETKEWMKDRMSSESR
jgi:Putative Actinobacterial Holin-X, holin superfamily III